MVRGTATGAPVFAAIPVSEPDAVFVAGFNGDTGAAQWAVALSEPTGAATLLGASALALTSGDATSGPVIFICATVNTNDDLGSQFAHVRRIDSSSPTTNVWDATFTSGSCTSTVVAGVKSDEVMVFGQVAAGRVVNVTAAANIGAVASHHAVAGDEQQAFVASFQAEGGAYRSSEHFGSDGSEVSVADAVSRPEVSGGMAIAVGQAAGAIVFGVSPALAIYPPPHGKKAARGTYLRFRPSQRSFTVGARTLYRAGMDGTEMLVSFVALPTDSVLVTAVTGTGAVVAGAGLSVAERGSLSAANVVRGAAYLLPTNGGVERARHVFGGDAWGIQGNTWISAAVPTVGDVTLIAAHFDTVADHGYVVDTATV